MCIFKNMMKYTPVLCITLVFSFAISTEDLDWSGEELNCVDELKLDKKSIHALNKQFITPEDNDDFNNFVECYWKKKGIQHQNGEIDFHKLDELLLIELLKEYGTGIDESASIVAQIFENALSACKQRCIRGKSHGQTAVKVQNCIAREVQSAFMADF
ncbi:hypothetical protein ILUMI_10011 [Ignelater luminosus]|uniref:Uncharacterized protein n=1 Tax=Ignelater luminosus TaxID=2038154 RepID=A0A8K0D186_IGNLU|nr:hypothetical protein ILUMI_10011 [Ignelater luminosus]